MNYKAIIHIMPREEILDPQGKATLQGLHNLGIQNIDHVRIGKRIEMQVEAEGEDAAETQVREACNRLLVNPIMERFDFELKAAEKV